MLLSCSLQPEDGFSLSQKIEWSSEKIQNLRSIMVLPCGFQNYLKRNAKVNFRQLDKTAIRLIGVEDRLQFNNFLKEDFLHQYTNLVLK